MSTSRMRLFGALSAAIVAAGTLAATTAEAVTVQPGLSGGSAMSTAECGRTTVATDLGSLTGAGGRKGRFVCGPSGAAMAAAAGPTIGTKKLRSVTWEAATGGAFDAISFALTNAFTKEKKSFFTVEAEGDVAWQIASRQKKGSTHYVTLLFDSAVENARIVFNTKKKDGFRLSDLEVRPAVPGGPDDLTPSPVPLPPAALLLGAGLMTLAGLGRRRRPAA